MVGVDLALFGHAGSCS